MTTLKTSFNGVTYRVVLGTLFDKPIHRVQVCRVEEDGTEVWAFLAHRQHKAESRVKSYFAKEIKAHMGW